MPAARLSFPFHEGDSPMFAIPVFLSSCTPLSLSPTYPFLPLVGNHSAFILWKWQQDSLASPKGSAPGESTSVNRNLLPTDTSHLAFNSRHYPSICYQGSCWGIPVLTSCFPSLVILPPDKAHRAAGQAEVLPVLLSPGKPLRKKRSLLPPVSFACMHSIYLCYSY